VIPIRSSGAALVDPLSEVLSLLGVQCFLSRRLEAQGSWALRFPAYRHLKFGGIIEGTRWVWREGSSSALELHAGDFYLLTDGAPYCFASDLQATPVDGLAFMEEHLQSDGVVRFNAGEGPTVGTGGRFTFDDDVSNPLLRSLPPLIHIRGDAPAARPLRATLDLLTFETEAAHLGRAAISSSLCRIVLVNILRTHLASSTPEAGWLGALADPQIRTALMLMHGYVGRPWKVADLAREVAMSRTTFAERFKNLVGQAPLEYLTSWRMLIARNALQSDKTNLATLAEQVGYESDTAFSLAFKRTFGCSPGRYRSMARLRQVSSQPNSVVLETG